MPALWLRFVFPLDGTHTRGSFFSMLWCLSVQEALDDRMYRKMFICGHKHQTASLVAHCKNDVCSSVAGT